MAPERGTTRRVPLRVALIYAVAAALWILLSDWLTSALVRDPTALHLVNTAKGFVFVAVTAIVLYGVVRRDVGEIEAGEADAIERERRLSRIVSTAPSGILLLDTEGRFTFANERAQHILRLGGAEIEERTFDDPAWRIESVDGGPFPGGELPFSRVMESGETVNDVRFAIVHPDDTRTILSANSSPMLDAHGDLVGVVVGIEDMTNTYRADEKVTNLNRVYSTLGQMNSAIVRAHDVERLYAEACRIAVEYGRFRMAWVGILDPATGSVDPVAHAGHEDGYLRTVAITVMDEDRGHGPVGTAVRLGKLVISNDIQHDPFMAPWREGALERGYSSLASLPLRREGRVVGAFTIYSSQTGFFDAEEVHLLEELADDVSFGLQHIVDESSRRSTELELRKLADIVEKVEVGVFTTSGESPVVATANAAFATQHGYEPGEVVGMALADMLPPEDRADLPSRLAKAAEEGHVSYESVHMRKDGSRFPVSIDVTSVRDETGNIAYRIGTIVDLSRQADSGG